MDCPFTESWIMDRRSFCHQLLGTGLVAGSMVKLIDAAQLASAATGTTKVQWQKSLKAAQKLALQQDKPMMVVFSASWCTFCHKLDRETFADKRISSFIEREFVPVHLDFDKEPKVAKILEVERLPCTVFLTPQADLLLRTEGFANAKDFQSTLSSVLDKRTEIQQVRASTISR
jgi:uncharacterized protein YyaL (SSP411 family)